MQNTVVDQICEFNVPLTSPIEINDSLFLLADNGEIYRWKDGQHKNEFKLKHQPSGIAIDKDMKNMYVADLLQKAILVKPLEKDSEEAVLIKDYDGKPFIGPNSILYSKNQDALYFSDGGHFLQTSLENKIGSVYMFDLKTQLCYCLAFNCLAYPTDLALSYDEKIVYVCETCENQILRFIQTAKGIFYFNTFVQFDGRFGPIAIEVSNNNMIFVARYEIVEISNEGLISKINSNGEILQNIPLSGYPQITGLAFSKQKQNHLYFTETSKQQCCLLQIQQENQEEDDDDEIRKFK